MVELSEVDSNKWTPLLEQVNLARAGASAPPKSPMMPGGEEVKQIRQQQKDFSKEEINQLIAEYKAGSTIYELAAQFGCHRNTVSYYLKRHGIKMRYRPLTEEQIDEAVRLYESGLSMAKVGERLGVSSSVICKRLKERGVATRDPHGRPK